jgi:hypothetical protein
LLTPRYRPSTIADQCYQVRLLAHPAWSRFLATAFRSLVTTVRSPDHHSEINVPGLLLRIPAEPPFRRVRPFAPPLATVSTRAGSINAQDPLSDGLSSIPGVSSNLHSPLGCFIPSGSKRSIRFGPGQTRLPATPDPPSLPAAELFKGLGYGSTFQVRYASVSLLFLKPLGTSYIMHRCPRTVKGILRANCTFPQINERVFTCC